MDGANSHDGQRAGIRESLRWIEATSVWLNGLCSCPAYAADREADIMALLVRARQLEHAADYLIRCQHTHALPEGGRLWQQLAQAPVLGQVRFELSAGRGRKARSVTQRIRVQRVQLDDGAKQCLPVTCVLAEEIGAPKGAKPVLWRLLSNRQVDTLEQALELIDWYRPRWEIELLFLILKEGCRIEALQLQDIQRIETVLALYLVVAWLINQLMRLGRALPQLPADVLLDRDEWRAAYALIKKPVPRNTPPLGEVIRLIAQLGGLPGAQGGCCQDAMAGLAGCGRVR